MTGETTHGKNSTLSRRDILRIGAKGCTVASIGLGFTIAGGRLSLAEAAENEEAKKAKAEHVMVMGLDAKLNQFPGRAGTPDMVWVFGAAQFKDGVEQASNGRIYVEIHDGGALDGQVELLKKVQQGIVQAGDCTTQNAAQLIPLLNIMDVPYGIGANDDAFWRLLFSKEFNDIFRKATEERRVTLVVTHPWRRRLMLSRNVTKQVRLPQDLDGMKIRVTASKFEQLAMEILPAGATPIAWAETFGALKDGAIEGLHIAPGSGFDVGMAPVVGQIIDTEWMYNCDSFWVSSSWLKKLGPDLQEAVMQGALVSQKHIFDNYQTVLKDAIGLMPDSASDVGFKGAGTEVAFLTEEEKAEWRDYLSAERNSTLSEGIDTYGRDAYETMRKVVTGSGPTEPVEWWKL